MMNRVQEMIDERRDELPVGLAKDLLDACKAEQDEKPKLYRVVLTKVTSESFVDHCDDECTAEVKLQTVTLKPIVECLNREAFERMNRCAWHLFDEGMMHERWLKFALPYTLRRGDDEVWILHSIAPFVPKRPLG